MNKDDFKELSEIIKINEVSQKSQSYESDFHSYSEIDERTETYRITE